MSLLPSLIYIALTCCGVGMLYANGKYGFSDLIGSVVTWALLYWGGFFDPLLRAAS